MDQKRFLYAEGNGLAEYGVWAYLIATVLTATVVLRRARLAAVPGAIMVVAGAIACLDSHIYWPRGGLSMVVLGIGWAALALAAAGSSDPPVSAKDQGYTLAR